MIFKKNFVSKIIFYSIFTFGILTLMTGCNFDSTEEDNSLGESAVAETAQDEEGQNPVLKEEQEADSVQSEKESNIQLSGSFYVHVLALMPDYVVDDFTNNVAIVTCYLDVPFVVYLSSTPEEEGVTADDLEVGKFYEFEIEKKQIDKIVVGSLESVNLDPKQVIPMYFPNIISAKEITDGYGLPSTLHYELTE